MACLNIGNWMRHDLPQRLNDFNQYGVLSVLEILMMKGMSDDRDIHVLAIRSKSKK